MKHMYAKLVLAIILFVSIGLTVYIMVPRALIRQDASMIIVIFYLELLLLTTGLSLFATNFHGIF